MKSPTFCQTKNVYELIMICVMSPKIDLRQVMIISLSKHRSLICLMQIHLSQEPMNRNLDIRYWGSFQRFSG